MFFDQSAVELYTYYVVGLSSQRDPSPCPNLLRVVVFEFHVHEKRWRKKKRVENNLGLISPRIPSPGAVEIINVNLREPPSSG